MKSEMIRIRMQTDVKGALKRAATQSNQSLSEFLTLAALEKASAMRADGWRVKELPAYRDFRKERSKGKRRKAPAAEVAA